MAGVKISDLPASAGGSGSDLLPTAQGSSTVKTTFAQIVAFVQSALFGNGLLPTGGTTGQVLAKVNNTDFDVAWVTSAAVAAAQSVEVFTLSPTDISNGYVTLAHQPAVAANVAAFVGGNTPGIYGVDFTMATAVRLSWSALGFNYVIAGDKLVANYWYY
jgi:hypothetical protein